MELYDVCVEYRKNPIGLDITRPRFSWKLKSDKQNTRQEACQIQVILDGEMVWDSGIRKSAQSVLTEYAGKELQAESVYRYRVIVWDNHGGQATAMGTFETGLLAGENFQAQWITHGMKPEETACPNFVKKIRLNHKVRCARIYATALGVYEICMNGKRVGDIRFAPGWTNYWQRLQYQTYDVTEFLSEENVIEITVGNGWYKGIFGFTCTPNHYGDRTAVLAELHVTYEDGTKAVVGTDESWKVMTGSVRYSEIYMGETIDSTVPQVEVKNAELFTYPKERILAQECEPVRITERIPAKNLIITPRGEKVLDFGQNMAGIVEVKVQGKAGQEVKIRHAETLDKEGNFYPDTLRSAISVDTYVCDGSKQVFLPHFTFHGFRYICVEGLEEVVPENFTACVLHSDMKMTGSFLCSDELVNQLQSNIQWGQKSNFLDVPTDCPQRDERLGWTGDAQVFCRTACFNMETASFFRKWLHDLKSEQTKEFGPPHVVPNILGNQDAAAAWCDAATIIPWTVYQCFGDTRILGEQYESMKEWVDYISARCGENGLWQTGFQYGDWLALDKEESADRTGATDKYLVANAYYAYSVDIVRKAAKVLGHEEDAAKYADLYRDIVSAFREEYVTRTGRLVSETQTACVLALHFNLIQDEYRDRVARTLEGNLANHKNHLSTGFVGTPYLCHALSENHMHSLAGEVFLKTDYPSWLYAVKKGATTIWERWNSILPDGSFETSGMNSLNHYAYGSIGDWMYEVLAGIRLEQPGYREFQICPVFIKGLTWVDASLDTVYGTIRSGWKCENGKITIDITVPANTTAHVQLPEKRERMTLGSGNYHYEYATEISLEKEVFTRETTLGELLQEPVAVELLNKQMPSLIDDPMIEFALGMSIGELIAMIPPEGQTVFDSVIKILNQKPICTQN